MKADPKEAPEGSELAGILGDHTGDIFGYVHDGFFWRGPQVWGGMKDFGRHLVSYEWVFAKAKEDSP